MTIQRTWGLLLLFYLFIAFLLTDNGYRADLDSWAILIDSLKKYGITGYYFHEKAPYLPTLLYILQLFDGLTDDTYYRDHLYIFKYVGLFFHAGISAIILKWIGQRKQPAENIFYILFNFALLYNAMIWGQIDDLPVFFLVILLYLLWNLGIQKNSKYLKYLFFAVGFVSVLFVCTKPQFLIFVPLLFIGLSYRIWEISKTKNIIQLQSAIFLVTSGSILGFCLLFHPFLLSPSSSFSAFKEVIGNSSKLFNFVSANAYNFWTLLLSDSEYYTRDNTILIGSITYIQAGIIIFWFQFITLMILLIRKFWLFQNSKESDIGKLLLLGCIIIGLQFFLFPTQIHERYAHPAIWAAGILSVIYPRKIFTVGIIILSVAYFINLENILRYLRLAEYNTFPFSRQWVAILYLTAYILYCYELYILNPLTEVETKNS